ncbi:double zinc ribbon domain-containing protein [Desulfurivibrio sp. D14AmB]|uniref:double zinc ribbon domain-containing protein n=1 Tax=Desulfurivibrio sp. D14AmB TaxID=3374370 RepID=UPI00376EEDB6
MTTAPLSQLPTLSARGEVARRGPAAWARAGLDLLYPPRCLGCQVPLPHSLPPLFCADCLGQIYLLASPLCSRCGLPLPGGSGPDHHCGACLRKPPRFQRARAAVFYDPPMARAIQAWKYGGELAGMATFATLAHHAPAVAQLAASDYILPVPLHRRRLRQRGFNQALLLARAIFPRDQSKIRADLLLRQRWTEPQTGMDGSQRRLNLRGAFTLRQPVKVKNRRILLVDDVLTTGSTVNECAKVLTAAGAAAIEVLTLARVRE